MRNEMTLKLATELYPDTETFTITGVIGECKLRDMAESCGDYITTTSALMDISTKVFRRMALEYTRRATCQFE
jgi:hypothetical protein